MNEFEKKLARLMGVYKNLIDQPDNKRLKYDLADQLFALSSYVQDLQDEIDFLKLKKRDGNVV
jgi:hypothetical protein